MKTSQTLWSSLCVMFILLRPRCPWTYLTLLFPCLGYKGLPKLVTDKWQQKVFCYPQFEFTHVQIIFIKPIFLFTKVSLTFQLFLTSPVESGLVFQGPSLVWCLESQTKYSTLHSNKALPTSVSQPEVPGSMGALSRKYYQLYQRWKRWNWNVFPNCIGRSVILSVDVLSE